jgi:hypothetical protein
MTLHLTILQTFRLSEEYHLYEKCPSLVWLIFSDVSADPAASIFRVPEHGRSMCIQKTTRRCLLIGFLPLSRHYLTLGESV